jgi:hypothetical protein
VHNLFIPPADTDDHFIKLYITEELFNLLEKKGSSGKYISSKDLIEKFNSFGYRINSINTSLLELMKLGLVDTDNLLTDVTWQILPANTNIGITSKGYYYYKQLIGRFHYIDLVLQDTPIFEKEYFDTIKSSFPISDPKGKRLLFDRAQTANSFLEYLSHMEKKQPRQLLTAYGSLIDYITSILKVDIKNMNLGSKATEVRLSQQ